MTSKTSKRPGASFTKLTCVSDVTLGNFLLCNTYNYAQQCNSFLLLNANPELQWQIINRNISQNFSLSVIFLDVKFCKNLEFPLSEHCEWATWPKNTLFEVLVDSLFYALDMKKRVQNGQAFLTFTYLYVSVCTVHVRWSLLKAALAQFSTLIILTLDEEKF